MAMQKKNMVLDDFPIEMPYLEIFRMDVHGFSHVLPSNRFIISMSTTR